MLTAFLLAAGVWLVGAPWVLGYSSEEVMYNDVACGAVIVLLSLARLIVRGSALAVGVVTAVLGAWALAAAAWLAESTAARWNDAVVGALVLLFAKAGVFAGRSMAKDPPGSR